MNQTRHSYSLADRFVVLVRPPATPEARARRKRRFTQGTGSSNAAAQQENWTLGIAATKNGGFYGDIGYYRAGRIKSGATRAPQTKQNIAHRFYQQAKLPLGLNPAAALTQAPL